MWPDDDEGWGKYTRNYLKECDASYYEKIIKQSFDQLESQKEMSGLSIYNEVKNGKTLMREYIEKK